MLVAMTQRPVEYRAAGDDSQPAKVEGYAAVFYRGDEKQEYRLFDDMVERIAEGAFDDALASDDVRALFNHDDNYVLARSTSGTLRLSTDEVGLRYSFEVDEADPDHQRVARKIQRGDVDGSSFGFQVVDESFERSAGVVYRTINRVKLYDVGPVTFPAYTATSSEMRKAGHPQIPKYLLLQGQRERQLKLMQA